MAFAATTTPLRQILDEHSARLSAEVERLLRETRERSRGESIAQLNQAARRLHQAADREDLLATLAHAAAAYAGGVAVFRIEGEVARGERIHGLPEEPAERFRGLRIPLSGAAALASAASGSDPVTAAATAAEVSPEMIQLVGHGPGERVSLFPLAAAATEAPKTPAFALLYAWGDVEVAAVELLSQVAAAAWPAPVLAPVVAVETADKPSGLVQIQSATPPKRWEDLPPAEQQLHLRAQRFARVRVAEVRLRQAPAVQAGRARGDLYISLQGAIDAARQEFRETFFGPCPSMVDYLHLELVRVLANDEVQNLGSHYPGPLV